MPHLYLFGDSITWGSWDPIGGGWAQRLKVEIDAYQIAHPHFWCPTFNLGIPGDTSAGVLKRFGNEVEARFDPSDEPVILIAIGINDSIKSEETQSISVEEYRENLHLIFQKARIYTKKVGCIGLCPIDERLLTPVPWSNACSYTTDRAELFLRESASVCQAQKIPLLNLWKCFEGKKYETYLSDGLHPNSYGHQIIHLAVRDFLKDTSLLVEPFCS